MSMLLATARRGPFGWLGVAALLPMLTALFGYCPLYALLGADTRRRRLVE
jgi:hypothetical protein